MVAVLIYKMLQQVNSCFTESAPESRFCCCVLYSIVYLPHIESTVIYHIVVQYCVHSGPEFAGCPDEDGELYEDCTLTE